MAGRVCACPGIGIVYGIHEFDIETVKKFVNWLNDNNHQYGRILAHQPGSCEFNASWLEIAEHDSEGFKKLQDEFKQIM